MSYNHRRLKRVPPLPMPMLNQPVRVQIGLYLILRSLSYPKIRILLTLTSPILSPPPTYAPSVPIPPQRLPRTLPRSVLHLRTGHAGSIGPDIRARAGVQFSLPIEKGCVNRTRDRHQM